MYSMNSIKYSCVYYTQTHPNILNYCILLRQRVIIDQHEACGDVNSIKFGIESLTLAIKAARVFRLLILASSFSSLFPKTASLLTEIPVNSWLVTVNR
jgi:hypothetical protein